MKYKCATCGHTSNTRCGHHELQAEIGTLIETNRLLKLQAEKAWSEAKTENDYANRMRAELDAALLQLRAMAEERDLYSNVADAAKLWLKHHGEVSHSTYYLALKYQVERLGQKVTEKPKSDCVVERSLCVTHRKFAEDCTEKRMCERVVAVNTMGEVHCSRPKPCDLHG